MSTDGAGAWTVDSLSVENLNTSTTYTYTGPTQAFNYTISDAFFAQQLAPTGNTAFTSTTNGVRYEYVTQVPATLGGPVATELPDTQVLAGVAQLVGEHQADEDPEIAYSDEIFEQVPRTSTQAFAIHISSEHYLKYFDSLPRKFPADDALDLAFEELELSTSL